MRIDNLMVQKITLCVKASYLTSVGETGIESENTFLAKWCREEKLTKIFGKDLDSFIIGTLLTQSGKLFLNARIDKTFEGVFNSLVDESLTDSVSTYKLTSEACDTLPTVN